MYCDLKVAGGLALDCNTMHSQDTGTGVQGERGARHGPATRARGTGEMGARPGCVAGLWAVHLVHSACFLPGLTQYCS